MRWLLYAFILGCFCWAFIFWTIDKLTGGLF